MVASVQEKVNTFLRENPVVAQNASNEQAIISIMMNQGLLTLQELNSIKEPIDFSLANCSKNKGIALEREKVNYWEVLTDDECIAYECLLEMTQRAKNEFDRRDNESGIVSAIAARE